MNFGSFNCSSESDITFLVFPDELEYNDDANNLSIFKSTGDPVPIFDAEGELLSPAVDYLVGRDFHKCIVGIIQCKTNWNDNAQIPMLWDLIYSVDRFAARTSVQVNRTRTISELRDFRHAFMIVPTQKT